MAASNKLRLRWVGGGRGGVSVCHGWGINATKRRNVSCALKHYLQCCLIGWWRFLRHCPWYIAGGRNREGNNVVTRGHKGKGKKRGSTESSSTVVKGNSPICFLLQSSKTKHCIHYNDDLMISWLDGNLHALDWDWHEHWVSFYCLQKKYLNVHHYCYFYGCPSWWEGVVLPNCFLIGQRHIKVICISSVSNLKYKKCTFPSISWK